MMPKRYTCSARNAPFLRSGQGNVGGKNIRETGLVGKRLSIKHNEWTGKESFVCPSKQVSGGAGVRCGSINQLMTFPGQSPFAPAVWCAEGN